MSTLTPDMTGRPWAEGVDYVDITLTILSFSDDGEEAVVEDLHGNRAVLPTSDFHQDEKDALDPGDTVLCHVLAASLASPIGTLEPDVPAGRACHDCVHGGEEGDVNNLPPACRDCWGEEGKPGFQARETVRAMVTELPPLENREARGTVRATVTELPPLENREARETVRATVTELPPLENREDADEATISENGAAPEDEREEDGKAEEDAEEVEEDEEPTDPGAAAVHFVRSETITARVGLSPEEREEIGDRMAKTVSRMEELKDELDDTRKSINERIKSLQQQLKEASEAWENGAATRDVYCDLVADYAAGDMVWREHGTGREIQRRPMTAEERQFPLPIVYPDADTESDVSVTVDAPGAPDELPPERVAWPDDGFHTCFNCACRLPALNDEDPIPEPCRTCSQARNGGTDNWSPERECRTCAHATCRINEPPCAGCALNADDEHRGEADRWEWKDAPESGDEDGGAESDAPDEAREGFFDPVTGELLPSMPPAGNVGSPEDGAAPVSPADPDK